ncbi:hypothetical protein [Sedimentitalea todarodis]|uniref:hypothetical protein n=1 Tax=Sedimentitalea todarodis TaxID=1631240 RepID=UPI003744A05C
MGDAVKLTGFNWNTLKQHFETLVDDGQLELHGRGRGLVFDPVRVVMLNRRRATLRISPFFGQF